MILTGSQQGKSFLLFLNFPGRLRSKKFLHEISRRKKVNPNLTQKKRYLSNFLRVHDFQTISYILSNLNLP